MLHIEVGTTGEQMLQVAGYRLQGKRQQVTGND
jgi:hypothetical protein